MNSPDNGGDSLNEPQHSPKNGQTNQRDAGVDAGNAPQPEISIPPGATEIRQTKWAWIWSAIPWIVVSILFGLDNPSLALFPIGLGIAVSVPRYIGWRKTAYYVTHNSIIYQRGQLGTTQTYELPAEHFQRVVERPGMFGRLLGYHAVDIRMKESGRVSLSWVPATAGLTERVIRMRDRYSDYDEEVELLELEMIAARQRGEIPPDYDSEVLDEVSESVETPRTPRTPRTPEMPDHDSPTPTPVATNDEPGAAPDEPDETPSKNRDRPGATGASDYRPDVREYRADRDGRDK